MKKRVPTLIALAVVVAMLVAVLCGCNATPAKVFGNVKGESYPMSVSNISSVTGATVADRLNGLIVFSKNVDTPDGTTVCRVVYSMRAGKLVSEFTDKQIDINVASGAVFSVTNTDEATVSYYDAFGNVLAKDISTSVATDITEDYAIIGNNVYILKNKEWDGRTIEKSLGWDDDIANATAASKSYYYSVNNNVIKVFDRKTLCLHSVVNGNEYAYESTVDQQAWFLTDDIILLQYEDRVATDADEYDVLLNGNKRNLRHYAYNVSKGKLKEIKNYGYYIVAAGSVSEMDNSPFDSKINDVMFARAINADRGAADIKGYVIKSNLKVTYKLDDITYDIDWLGGISKFGSGYVIGRNDGSSVVMDKNGKKIKELGDAAVCGDYAVVGNTVYTFNGKKMVEKAKYADEEYAIINIAEGYVLLGGLEDGSLYGCKVGETPLLIAEGANVDISRITSNRIYTVKDAFENISIYSVNGSMIASGLSSLQIITRITTDDGSILTLACMNENSYIVIE